MRYFIDVILPIPVENLFTYEINKAEAAFLKTGMRVSVPFGKSKIYTALVYKVHQTPPEIYEAKEIHQILDESPIVTQHQIAHWKWISAYYMCTLGEVFRAAVPSAFLLESETIITRGENFTDKSLDLKDDEWLVYEALQHQSILRIQEISDIIDRKNALPVLHRLMEKQVITLKEELYEQYKPKMVKYARLHESYQSDEALHLLLDELDRAPKQKKVILALFSMKAIDRKPITIKRLSSESGASAAIIKALQDKGILDVYSIRKDRISFDQKILSESKELNEYQQTALAAINTSFEQKEVTLLHGITSSGKTEVYVKLIEKIIASGKQVLYLLPEIALTTQLISRLKLYFADQISIYHSKYNVHERIEVWNNILNKQKKARIIVGARSAIFLPFTDLGLIIIDEEHETSFRQHDPAPRYHARDSAIVLAAQHHAKTLLGSATPSIESYLNAKENKYGFAAIKRRYGNVLLPEMELVDLKEKRRKKQIKGHFSDRLIEEISIALSNKEQVILFQNRRGYAPIVECNICGHSPQCPNCDVSLTYHQFRKQLRCHYCGYHMAWQQQCRACGSNELDTKGFGTEQIANELDTLFPKAKTARMDSDTTRGKYGYEKIISSFEEMETDILVGTQMLTKGLDFRNVSLVGVMNADQLLNYPDFRAFERSFQLIQQVAGRAGRTQKRGKVLIQTYNPFHQILQQASTNDYEGMYSDELNDRIQFKYPPFFRLIRITFRHKDFNKLNEGAAWFAKAMRNNFGAYVLGPEQPAIGRIRNEYIKHITLKIPKKQPLGQTKVVIKRIDKSFKAVTFYRSIRVIYNVDPY
ncbi:primosomal protein N' [Ascidiimonas sp. W6]|uniref:replication restart helicase PriA n=1 Tax=Ascidiimonas meishanensis TaxID=3128903 RepID=UPI0030ECB194